RGVLDRGRFVRRPASVHILRHQGDTRPAATIVSMQSPVFVRLVAIWKGSPATNGSTADQGSWRLPTRIAFVEVLRLTVTAVAVADEDVNRVRRSLVAAFPTCASSPPPIVTSRPRCGRIRSGKICTYKCSFGSLLFITRCTIFRARSLSQSLIPK